MMRRPAPPLDSANMVHEILLKLPARDVARFRCVSKLWASVVADPSFSGLHAEADASRISAAASEALLVTETREPGLPDVASFSSFSMSRPLPRRIIIPNDYSLSNVCNGLLCFALNQHDAPVFICNPVTGETTTLPAAPPPVGISGGTRHHVFALGFSPSTKEHKLFRFSFSPFHYRGSTSEFERSVCTLDGARGEWRRCLYHTQCPLLHTVPPVLVDGKLYLVITGRTRPEEPRDPDGLLEVDVATEAHRMFRLPFWADEYHRCYDPLVNTFEMRGRLCLAVNTFNDDEDTTIRHRKLQFWLLSSPPPDRQIQDDDDSKLCWDLCYSFYVGDSYVFEQPRSAWFDDRDMTLWYRDYKALFKHGTSGRSPEPSPEADCPECDRRLELPPKPSNCSWHICGGYRPSFLSPLTLAAPPTSWDGEEQTRKFVQALFLLKRR